MDPTLIVFGIRSAVRLFKVGDAAFAQYARDKEVLFPFTKAADFSRLDVVIKTFAASAEREKLLTEGELAKYWARNQPNPAVPSSLDILYAKALELQAGDLATSDRADPVHAQEVAGGLLIEQWATGKGPLSPLAGAVLGMADIALEFVGAHPDILSTGGSGEKLLKALAQSLGDIIPDDPSLLAKSQIANRLVGVFLRAGLKTIGDNPGLVISEKHLQRLIVTTIPPILETLPSGTADRIDFSAVADALLGPAAAAALGVIAESPAAFLGDDFAPNEAIGALTKALLAQATKTGLGGAFTESGFLSLFNAALAVAAQRPSLFVGTGRPADELAEELFKSFITALHGAPPPFNGDFGAILAATALDVLRGGSRRLLRAESPWQDIAVQATLQIINGLVDGLGDRQAIERALSRDELLDLVRAVLSRFASAPGAFAAENAELRSIVGVIASGIADDEDLLLDFDDWLAIAEVIAVEAAADPGRLVALNTRAPHEQPAAKLLRSLVTAGQAVAGGGRVNGVVLFGRTLREAIILALTQARAEIDGETLRAIEEAVAELNDQARAQPGVFASREWLNAFGARLASVFQVEASP